MPRPTAPEVLEMLRGFNPSLEQPLVGWPAIRDYLGRIGVRDGRGAIPSLDTVSRWPGEFGMPVLRGRRSSHLPMTSTALLWAWLVALPATRRIRVAKPNRGKSTPVDWEANGYVSSWTACRRIAQETRANLANLAA